MARTLAYTVALVAVMLACTADARVGSGKARAGKLQDLNLNLGGGFDFGGINLAAIMCQVRPRGRAARARG